MFWITRPPQLPNYPPRLRSLLLQRVLVCLVWVSMCVNVHDVCTPETFGGIAADTRPAEMRDYVSVVALSVL